MWEIRFGGLAPLLGPVTFTVLALLGASVVRPPAEAALPYGLPTARGVGGLDLHRSPCAPLAGGASPLRPPA